MEKKKISNFDLWKILWNLEDRELSVLSLGEEFYKWSHLEILSFQSIVAAMVALMISISAMMVSSHIDPFFSVAVSASITILIFVPFNSGRIRRNNGVKRGELNRIVTKWSQIIDRVNIIQATFILPPEYDAFLKAVEKNANESYNEFKNIQAKFKEYH